MQLVCEGHARVCGASDGARFVPHPPQVVADPVVVGDTFVDRAGTSIYGSVLRDGGRYRMWYQAWPEDWDGRDTLAVACAESDDGLTWRKPAHGLMARGGSRANHLTDLPFHAPSVFVDPDADGARRYRAFGYTDPARAAGYGLPAGERGYYTAHSADGLHWAVEPGPLWPRADVITAAWDDWARPDGTAPVRGGAARIAFKNNGVSAGQYRRRFYTTEWRAGAAAPPVSAFVADEADDLAARARGGLSADFYGISWLPTPGPTVAFAWMFRHQPPLGRSPERLWTYGSLGQVDLVLLYQLERGGRWLQLPGRPDWLAADDVPGWGGGGLYGASHAIPAGDETWLYVCGTPERHGWGGAGVDLDTYRQQLAEAGGFARIGLLRWPRDRVMGYAAGLCEWVDLKPACAGPGEPAGLRLNVRTSRRGRVRAALLDGGYQPVSGYAFADCDAFAGDHLEATVTWRGSPRLPDRAVAADLVARVEIADGALYAFAFGRDP